VLVFVFAHLVYEVSERKVESAVLVFAVGFGPVGVSGAHQREFHAVTTDQPFTRMMTADGDVQILRLGIELGDLGDLVVYVTPKTISDFNVTSNDVQFHGDLL
jgi:hypothetical protein